MGRVQKGEKCSIKGCNHDAIRSISYEKIAKTGLVIDKVKRAYICKNHYKEYKKKTKNDRILEKWRFRT